MIEYVGLFIMGLDIYDGDFDEYYRLRFFVFGNFIIV